jgi:acetylornithine/succinyldiaminopimelate/putrescine aminotransferase/predicted amino acid dehydrogenase
MFDTHPNPTQTLAVPDMTHPSVYPELTENVESSLGHSADAWKPADEDSLASVDRYGNFVRPGLVEKLRSVNLDKVYTKAEGDYLYSVDADGQERPVLDLVGGYGSTLFGHNHPDLVAEAVIQFTRKRPFLAQGSIRPQAALLAQRLSERLKRTTGKDYVVTFANSGAEVNEAAIKHALLERNAFLDAARQAVIDHVFALRRDFRKSTHPADQETLQGLVAQLGRPEIHEYESFFDAVIEMAETAFSTPPVFLALEKGFHGKTTGALRLTANADFRLPFESGTEATTQFMGMDTESWERALATHRLSWFDLEADFTGHLHLIPKQSDNIAAVLLEPIQGEGGIRTLPESLVRFLMTLPDRRFPIVVDEIQSGMGRTGRFLASEHLGLIGDYVCLGKSLGGGIAKIGALLVQSDRFLPEFSVLHTSTFAEDDYSCAISLKTLDMVDAPAGPMHMATKKGAYLLASLARLKDKYPDVIAEVRGTGLMVGVELVRQNQSGSWLIRAVDNQKLLGYLVAGLLLNEYDIRIFPTLSSPNTLRLEPSCFIRLDALDRFISALDEVCRILRHSDMYRLSRYMLGLGEIVNGENSHGSIGAPGHRDGAAPRIFCDEADRRTKVAFLGHFIHACDIKHRDPVLVPIPDGLMADYFERTYRLFNKGECLEGINVCSTNGREVHLTFIGHYLTSQVIVESMRKNDIGWIRDRITDSVREAKKRGCKVVGFGGYTSIVTHNCQAVPVEGIGLTSGNSLTVGMAVEAIGRSAREQGIALQKACLGVVGATGNIGSTYSQILAENVGRLILFGTASSKRRLQRLVTRILAQAALELKAFGPDDCKGLARSLASDPTLLARVLAAEGQGEAAFKDVLETLYRDHGLARFIAISTDLADLRSCEIIVSASNDSGAVIHPHHLSDSPVIICDLAVPRDTSPLIELEKPNAHIIQGGIVRLPGNPDFAIGGIPLERGRTFACMAETLLLGLEDRTENFSHGEITKEQVKLISGLAAKHGFTLSEQKRMASF